MSFSTTDELEAIERAARGDPADPASETVSAISKEEKKDDGRRGSSMFANDTANWNAIESNGTEDDKNYGGGDDLLVDFPHSDDEDDDYNDESDEDELPPSMPRPTGVSSGMKRGIEDFDDDLRDGRRELPGAPLPGSAAPGSSRPKPFKEKCVETTAPATGSQNHRPLVGGFAAAAYEAAREYHYQSHARQQQNYPKRTGPPPSI